MQGEPEWGSRFASAEFPRDVRKSQARPPRISTIRMESAQEVYQLDDPWWTCWVSNLDWLRLPCASTCGTISQQVVLQTDILYITHYANHCSLDVSVWCCSVETGRPMPNRTSTSLWFFERRLRQQRTLQTILGCTLSMSMNCGRISWHLLGHLREQGCSRTNYTSSSLIFRIINERHMRWYCCYLLEKTGVRLFMTVEIRTFEHKVLGCNIVWIHTAVALASVAWTYSLFDWNFMQPALWMQRIVQCAVLKYGVAT